MSMMYQSYSSAQSAETVTQTTGSEEAIGLLMNCVQEESRLASFACGGSIPIISFDEIRSRLQTETSGGGADNAPSGPVTLRWDAPGVPTEKAKLTFPVENSEAGNLQSLVEIMQPAGFGMGGKLVFDETYRKASQMDPTDFAITFNPYESGIIDTIAQALLPSLKSSTQFRSVRAELYKMNIYSGASGKFKAHVDTPRSASQFGSLVVCLPVAHEGGQLVVRHEGKEITCDWSTAESVTDHASIRWSAFYSDCEHEVLEVKSGHRVTLTYNLYAVRGNGFLAGTCPTLDPSSFPFYQLVEPMLRDASFMEKGGYLGFYCRHAYPHTAKKSNLPDTLKGLDMVLFQTFKAIGLNPSVRPVILRGDGGYDSDGAPEGTIADSLMPIQDLEEEVENWWEMINDWEGNPDVFYHSVTWLSQPRHSQRAIEYTGYGNQPTSETQYSFCAIIIPVGLPGSRDVAPAPENVRTVQKYLNRREEMYDDDD